MAHKTVELVPTKHSKIKIAIWLIQSVLVRKKMKVAVCRRARTSRMVPQGLVSHTHALVPEKNMNATQVYKSSKPVK